MSDRLRALCVFAVSVALALVAAKGGPKWDF